MRRLLDFTRQGVERFVEQRANTPVLLPEYTAAGLPDPTVYRGGQIFVTDDIGGAVTAFSDGINWLRSTDRAVIT